MGIEPISSWLTANCSTDWAMFQFICCNGEFWNLDFRLNRTALCLWVTLQFSTAYQVRTGGLRLKVLGVSNYTNAAYFKNLLAVGEIIEISFCGWKPHILAVRWTHHFCKVLIYKQSQSDSNRPVPFIRRFLVDSQTSTPSRPWDYLAVCERLELYPIERQSIMLAITLHRRILF